MSGSKVRKFKVERQVGRILNPMVATLERIGLRSTLMFELETIGRRSGLARRIPVTGSADDGGAWVISQHGHRAGWAHNIDADPRVRVRIGDQWHTGTATFEPDDDVVARARSFASSAVGASATALAMRALQSDPISVRIAFTDADVSSPCK